VGGLVACSLVACSLLAPSDDELTGGLGAGSGGAAGSSPAVGTSGVGGTGNVGGGSAGSGETVGAYPVVPVGGSGGSSPSGPAEPPPDAPDAGPSEPPSCVDCETVRFTGGFATVELGTPGGSLYVEICPHDQVVVGMDYKFAFGTPADFGYFTSVALVCGELAPNRSTGTLDVVVGEPLAPRGAGAGVTGVGGRCPGGQVVTGFEGVRNFDGTTSEIREFVLHCAPLALADSSVAIGAASPAPAMSADFAVSTVLPDEILPLQPCPEGGVVRGAAVHAGTWVDGIRLICSAPVLSQPDGVACSSASECQSGSCDGTCQPRPCTPPAGCSCGLLESTQYAFCEAAQTRDEAAASCAAAGMHLSNAYDPIAHGWLRSSAGEEGIQAAFWLGADDLGSEGSWFWAQDGGAVDLASELWAENELRGGTDENCMAMTRDGHWDDVACALTLPFACEAPVPE
jgi:hypothetical protein